jgi:hypothetical protein
MVSDTAEEDIMARTNRYPAECQTCRTSIPASAGTLERDIEGVWMVTCSTPCAEPTPAAIDTAQVEAETAYLDAHGYGLFDPDSVLHAALIAGGFANPVSVRLPEPVKVHTRRNTRRRKACVTGGNCSSHSGRNCGGHNCDAN